jgi:hypothetical protein
VLTVGQVLMARPSDLMPARSAFCLVSAKGLSSDPSLVSVGLLAGNQVNCRFSLRKHVR